jgi:hypothetical protein
MSKTLFDLTYATAVKLGAISEGVATNGTTTTLVDTVELTQDDDFWNGGTAWITYDAGGLGAAPQGEYSVVTDFASSTDTATLRTTLSAAIASGDRYAIARTRYPLSMLISKINEAIRGIGPIEVTDISTITTADEKTEYTLPENLLDLREVWIQTNLDDTNDYRWRKLSDWRVEKETTGSANTLIIPQFEAGYLLKLVYYGYHAALVSATSKLDDSIHMDRVVSHAVVGLLLWRKAKIGEGDSTVNEMLNYFQNEASQMDAMHPVRKPPKHKTVDLTFDRP